jgi:biotin carboxylase
MELSQVYYSLGSVACALRSIELGLGKVQELRDVEEADPPLPDYIERSLSSNTRNLRLLELKFRVQGGMPIDQWKKKVEEYFSLDSEGRCIAIIESLRLSPPTQTNIFKQTALNTPIPSKD